MEPPVNKDLAEILDLRAAHFVALVAQLRDGLRARGVEVEDDTLVQAAVSLYEIDDDERLYGDDEA